MKERTGARIYGQSVGRFSISVGQCATVFQAKICGILAFAYEIQTNVTSEKYVFFSDKQATLKALRTAKYLAGILWDRVQGYCWPSYRFMKGKL